MKNKHNEKKWNQWLAGIIDAAGYLTIQKNNVAVCEITMALNDERLLIQIKQQLGGHIRLRAGAKAVRYRLSHQQGIKKLIHRINGFIRNSQRLPQFQRLCAHFEIPYFPASQLTLKNGYCAGFFDGNGTIFLTARSQLTEYATQKGILGKIHRLYYSQNANEIRIFISQKNSHDLTPFSDVFKFGEIYKVKQKTKTWYRWELKTELDILYFCDYLKKIPCRSIKNQHLFLIERYFELKQMGAHLAPKNTNLNKAWFLFCQKWYKS